MRTIRDFIKIINESAEGKPTVYRYVDDVNGGNINIAFATETGKKKFDTLYVDSGLGADVIAPVLVNTSRTDVRLVPDSIFDCREFKDYIENYDIEDDDEAMEFTMDAMDTILHSVEPYQIPDSEII